MRRYWLPEKARQAAGFLIEGDEFKHICRVCRRGQGDKFEILQPGKAYLVELTQVDRKQAFAQILEERQLSELPRPHLHLALSLPKLATLENVIEKSVELGVHSLHVFTSEFSFIKSNSEELFSKKKRWDKIIKGATQQTGRGDLMALTFGQELGVLLKEFAARPSAWGIFAFEGHGQQSLRQGLAQVPDRCEEVWIFVGSEGGFSPGDIELFNDYKLIPTSLGEQVLRVETACVTLISIIKYGLGQLD